MRGQADPGLSVKLRSFVIEAHFEFCMHQVIDAGRGQSGQIFPAGISSIVFLPDCN